MARHLNKALPFEAWPSEDKRLWGQAFEGTDLFDSRREAKASASTKYGRKAACALYFGFLTANYPALLDQPLHERVTRELVEEYVDGLRENCQETTIHHCIGRLFYVLRAMCPERDWDWLYRISRRIAARAEPIKHPQVLSSDLYSLGLKMMDRALVEANALGRLSRSCAVRYRDGLITATLAEAPMRRKPFSLLQIGGHVIRMGGRWCLTVPPELTKTKVAQDYELSERLSGYMDLYLGQIRRAFPGADTHNGLWPHVGSPMTDKMIRRRTIKWTRLALGVAVSPHRFRNAAATFLSVTDPENIRVAKDLLGHRSFAMTEKHYIDAAQSRQAGIELERLLAEARDGIVS